MLKQKKLKLFVAIISILLSYNTIVESKGTPSVGFFGPHVLSQNEDGRLEVFVKGKDGELWHIYQVEPNAPWSPWENLGMPSW